MSLSTLPALLRAVAAMPAQNPPVSATIQAKINQPVPGNAICLFERKTQRALAYIHRNLLGVAFVFAMRQLRRRRRCRFRSRT